ncbi:MAG TPA: methyltransferase domain-containing protein [Blastococcus sp.]|nr:methyltransferase domain-containing protein [Blastococcus sp.]
MKDPVPLTPRTLGASLRTGPTDGRPPRSRGRSFGAVAAGYAALRPTYPAEAVAFLLGDGGPRRVLDLGAGTGLLTEVLQGIGHDVRAVDPSPEMLAELTARLPGVGAAVGTAEAIPWPTPPLTSSSPLRRPTGSTPLRPPARSGGCCAPTASSA